MGMKFETYLMAGASRLSLLVRTGAEECVADDHEKTRAEIGDAVLLDSLSGCISQLV